MLKSLKFFILLITIFSSNISANTYTMPVGIPETNIDFTAEAPQRPSNWNEEIPGYYYVDLNIGSDSRNYGSEEFPRKTIPKTLPAGSYVEVAGEYSYASGGLIKIYGEGTDEMWEANKSGLIWITSSPKSEGSFTNSTVLLWGKNIVLTDLKIKNNSKIQIGSATTGFAATNIVVRNSEFIGTLSMGNGTLLAVKGEEKTRTENIILFNNILRDAGDIMATTDIDAGLISSSGYASYIWILGNIGYNASGGGLQVNARPPRDASHNVYAGNNEFYNVRQGGLWVKYATDVVFSTNYVHDIISTSWSPAKGLGGQYEPNGLWIINNIIHDVEYGIRVPSTTDIGDEKLKIYVIGNLIYDISTETPVGTTSSWESAGIHMVGAQEHYIYNNLIFNAPNGINISGYDESVKTIIENNIIVDVQANHKTGESGYHIWAEGRKDTTNLSVANNFFGVDMNVKLGGEVYNTTSLLSSRGSLNNTTEDLSISTENIDSIFNSLILNPIVSAKLQDKGKNNNYTIIDIFKSKFTSTQGINSDILGQNRSLGNSIDIGPFEQDGLKIEAITPEKPTNIKLNIKS